MAESKKNMTSDRYLQSQPDAVHKLLAPGETMDALELRVSLMVRGAVTEGIKEAIKEHGLEKEKMAWVELAMKREARREELHRAIVEKTLGGLVWAVIIGAFAMLYEWAVNHGYKP